MTSLSRSPTMVPLFSRSSFLIKMVCFNSLKFLEFCIFPDRFSLSLWVLIGKLDDVVLGFGSIDEYKVSGNLTVQVVGMHVICNTYNNLRLSCFCVRNIFLCIVAYVWCK